MAEATRARGPPLCRTRRFNSPSQLGDGPIQPRPARCFPMPNDRRPCDSASRRGAGCPAWRSLYPDTFSVLGQPPASCSQPASSQQPAPAANKEQPLPVRPKLHAPVHIWPSHPAHWHARKRQTESGYAVQRFLPRHPRSLHFAPPAPVENTRTTARAPESAAETEESSCGDDATRAAGLLPDADVCVPNAPCNVCAYPHSVLCITPYRTECTRVDTTASSALHLSSARRRRR